MPIAYALTEDAWRWLRSAVQRVHHDLRRRDGRQPISSGRNVAQHSGWVQTTSTTLTGGRYPGQYGTDDESATDPGIITAQGTAGDIEVREANGSALTTGTWYWGRLENDTSSGVPVYVVYAPAATVSTGYWTYKTTTTMADPGSGNLRLNTATPATATAMAISSVSARGTDTTNLLRSLVSGDRVYVQDQTTASNWIRYRLTAAATDNTTWFQLAITQESGSGTVPGNNNVLLVQFTQAGGGGGGGGSGTVTSVSVTTANGVSGTVATATTTPAITLTLGAITPTSVAATGTVTGSNLSGTNTGDQTLSGLGGVPTTRTISTIAPLAGGGDLSANRTLTVSDFTTSARGTVPASGGGTTNFLRADGTWTAPPSPGSPA